MSDAFTLFIPTMVGQAVNPQVSTGQTAPTGKEGFGPMLAQAMLGGGIVPNLRGGISEQVTGQIQPGIEEEKKELLNLIQNFSSLSLGLKEPVNVEKLENNAEGVKEGSEKEKDLTLEQQDIGVLQMAQEIMALLNQGKIELKDLKLTELVKGIEPKSNGEIKNDLSAEELKAITEYLSKLTGEAIPQQDAGSNEPKNSQQKPQIFGLESTTNVQMKSTPQESTGEHKLTEGNKNKEPQLNAGKTDSGLQSSANFINTLDAKGVLPVNVDQNDAAKLDARFTQPLKESILNQVVSNMSLNLKEGQSEMRIHLKPDYLGHMAMKVAVEDGIVTASFTVESLQVKEILESNLSNLRQSLTNQGLKVDNLTVNVGNGDSFSDLSRRQPSWVQRNIKPAVSKEVKEEIEGIVSARGYQSIPGWRGSSMEYVV